MPICVDPQGNIRTEDGLRFDWAPLLEAVEDPDLLRDNWDKLDRDKNGRPTGGKEKDVARLLTVRFAREWVDKQHRNWLDRQREFVQIYGAYQEALRRGDPQAEDYQEDLARWRARWHHVDTVTPGGLFRITEAWQGLRVPDHPDPRELEAADQCRFTQAEIADMLGITAGRVTQIVRQIEAKLGIERG